MPRLRTTTASSLLALFAGILGTQWLCTLTDDWVGPRAQVPTLAARLPHRRSHAPPHVVGAITETQAAAGPVATPSLVPLGTPPDPVPYASLRGHLDGRVVLNIATDGSGRVRSAGIAQSSGDAILDAHALATVRRWRFAVPAGAPGVQGQLPMRFDSSPPATPP